MIISIYGKLGSGKDTLGQIIQYLSTNPTGKSNQTSITFDDFCKYSYSSQRKKCIWKIKKFADKLKDIVCLLIGCTREQLEDREFRDIPLREEWNKLKVRYSDGYDEVEDIFSLDFDFSTLLDAKGKQAYIHSIEVIKLTPRILLQLLGTEAGRDIIHPDIWVNSLMSGYKGKRNLAEKIGTPRDLPIIYPNWIITDNRFPNETKRVKKEGGIIIKIQRDINLRHPGYNSLEEVKQKNIELYKQLTHYSETALDNYNKWDYTIYNNGTIEELIEQVKQILQKENII